MKYRIEDWAGNLLHSQNRFGRKSMVVKPMLFDSFLDGWDYIYENFNDDEYQELYVLSETEVE